MNYAYLADTRAPKLVQDAWLKPKMTPGNVRRAVPYQIARSSLFAALPHNLKTRKDYSCSQDLETYSGFTITQTKGQQLVQRDGTVWFELLHLALKQEDDGDSGAVPVLYTENGLLKALGQTKDSENRRNLRTIIQRLCDAAVTVEQGMESSWSGQLVLAEGPKLPTAIGQNILYLDRAFAKCFKGGYTLLNREQRHLLRNQPLAQWMHAFYSTHRAPRPLKGNLILRLSGCHFDTEDAGQDKLILALKVLSGATNWKCSYNPMYDMVHVDRGHNEQDTKVKKSKAFNPASVENPNDI